MHYKEAAHTFYEEKASYDQGKRRHYGWRYCNYFRQEIYQGRECDYQTDDIACDDLFSVEMRIHYFACPDYEQAYRRNKQDIHAENRIYLGNPKHVQIDYDADWEENESCNVSYEHKI